MKRSFHFRSTPSFSFVNKIKVVMAKGTHQSCQAFRKGREVSRVDFEDLRKSLQMMASVSDPLIRSSDPSDDRLHRKQLCHCYLNLRRYFALEVIVSLNAVDCGLHLVSWDLKEKWKKKQIIQ